MALPKIDAPLYDVIVPSSGDTITVRPFTVKEEKLLLIAIESKNPDEIVKTVKQVVNNCIEQGDFDVDKAPFFDIDYLFIFLRAKSVGDTVEVNLTCNNLVDGERCGNVFPTDLDVSKCEILEKEESDLDIPLSDTKGIKMKYPTYAVMKHIEFGNPIDTKTNTIINSIDYIYDDDGVYPAKDHSKEELKEFVEGLTEANYKKLEKFIDNFPTFAVNLEAECSKCGFHHNVRYTDFYDFFFLIMGHDKLANYFRTNFALLQHHKWGIDEIESMMPWERHVYVDLLQDFIKSEEQRMRDEEADRKARINQMQRRRL